MHYIRILFERLSFSLILPVIFRSKRSYCIFLQTIFIILLWLRVFSFNCRKLFLVIFFIRFLFQFSHIFWDWIALKLLFYTFCCQFLFICNFTFVESWRIHVEIISTLFILELIKLVCFIFFWLIFFQTYIGYLCLIHFRFETD